MLRLVRKENEQNQTHIFQDTYFESFKILQLIIRYNLEHINHDNLLNIFI